MVNKELYIKTLFTIIRGRLPSVKEYNLISSKYDEAASSIDENSLNLFLDNFIGPQGETGPQGQSATQEQVNAAVVDYFTQNPITGNNECFAIINADGSIKAQSGTFAIGVTRLSVGNYSITFTTPFTDNNYIIKLSNKEDAVNRDDVKAFYDANTNVGFSVWIGEQDNGGTGGVFSDREFMLHIIKI